MRGASAESLAALTQALDGALGAEPEQVGNDLFRVSGTLRAEPGLRRVATDVSVPADAKSGLVRQIFSGKIGQGALGLVEAAAGRRWTEPRDLADALEHLGVMATVKSAGEADRVSAELFTVGQVIKDNPALRDALSDPARSRADKSDLVRGLLKDKALSATISLVDQALAGTHRTVGAALEEYRAVAAEVHGQRVATVRVARPLADADRQRLTEVLTRQYGRPVHLDVVVDASVIGGIRVEIGDEVIDGTVSSRLDEAGRRLAG